MVQTGEVKQYLEQQVTRGYQSSSSRILHFGLGKSEVVDLVKVRWPDGKVSELINIPADQLINVDYSSAVWPNERKNQKPFLFSDVTDTSGIDFRHTENVYDDYQREIMLPYKMSELGPALAVGDVNGDGLDDFFVGGAMGYAGALFIQKPDATFIELKQQALIADRAFEDLDAVFFDADGDGNPDLYVVSGGTEHPADSPFYQDRLYINDGNGRFTRSADALPEFFTSGGVVCAGDLDADGDPDLFVGGRVVPGRYPEAPESHILENEGGVFREVTKEVAPDLMNEGLVTDAVWSDFNRDGMQDLVLVGEWMPVTLMLNTNGKLNKDPGDTTFANSRGWWFSITEADLDQDGDPDYILGNLGDNYIYKASPERPFKIFLNDFDNNGHADIVLGYYEDSILYPVHGRDYTVKQIPGLKNKYKDYHSFGLATLEDIYGAKNLASSYQLKATTFSNSILLNTDSGFVMESLPSMAQISAVFGSVYDDFDGDGVKDIVIAGNLYNSEIKIVRNDAGQGLFLKGKGDAVFAPVKGYRSGLFIPGDVKKLKGVRLGTESKKGILVGINDDYVKLISVDPDR